MAYINILVHANPDGSFHIWAKHENAGRVCCGKLTGSSRGLTVSSSRSACFDKKKEGYKMVLRIVDDNLVVKDDSAFSSIIGLISGALLNELGKTGHPISAKLQAMGVHLNYMNRRLDPDYYGEVDRITIRDLRQIPEDEHDIQPAPTSPLPLIRSAGLAADPAWDF